MIEHIKNNKTQAVLLSLDAEKAFDRVSCEFLYRVLQKFRFHQTFIATIRALYSIPEARIKINGSISNSFGLKRGTRQVYPISPLLFAIFIEALSLGITQDNSITGIYILRRERKILHSTKLYDLNFNQLNQKIQDDIRHYKALQGTTRN